jgi:hypothetical protein
MLNIPHTKNTLVGDEFVRGVSGGERKRVSIAEMMATRARVQCWDNSTRGLDASTALDFVRSLRVMTDILGQTTFVSLCVHVILLITMSSNFPAPGIKLARAFTICSTKSSCWIRATKSFMDQRPKLVRILKALDTTLSLARLPPTISLVARMTTNANSPRAAH